VFQNYQAWTEETLSYQGKYWRIPPGETLWEIAVRQKWGRGVENGIVKAVSVVPKPVQKPHPPVFQPFASSERSIRWVRGRECDGGTAVAIPDYERQWYEIYAAASAPRWALGWESCAIL
jgi:alkanesulfonate monooxygenase SsuD/methylene tetrahydromethanopterin reductase-like flavin-dependent oxidoreductase (luciferase family)